MPVLVKRLVNEQKRSELGWYISNAEDLDAGGDVQPIVAYHGVSTVLTLPLMYPFRPPSLPQLVRPGAIDAWQRFVCIARTGAYAFQNVHEGGCTCCIDPTCQWSALKTIDMCFNHIMCIEAIAKAYPIPTFFHTIPADVINLIIYFLA